MLPLYVAVSGKRALVFGGGSVAERKICRILEIGTQGTEGHLNIEVYSREFTPRIEAMQERGEIQCFRCDLWDQNVDVGELIKDAFLIIICTSNDTLNEHLSTESANARCAQLHSAQIPHTLLILAQTLRVTPVHLLDLPVLLSSPRSFLKSSVVRCLSFSSHSILFRKSVDNSSSHCSFYPVQVAIASDSGTAPNRSVFILLDLS
jgi:hypothetical protein